jgi:hypothetical protein
VIDASISKYEIRGKGWFGRAVKIGKNVEKPI